MDKSNICTNTTKAKQAAKRHSEILKVDTDLLEKVCPNPCVQVSSFYASQEEKYHGDSNSEFYNEPASLTLHYREVSQSLIL